MISWVKAKWLAQVEKRKKKRALKRLEDLRKHCIHCRLWREGEDYRKALSGASYMPRVYLTICPCKLHGTQEEIDLYEENREK